MLYKHTPTYVCLLRNAAFLSLISSFSIKIYALDSPFSLHDEEDTCGSVCVTCILVMT